MLIGEYQPLNSMNSYELSCTFLLTDIMNELCKPRVDQVMFTYLLMQIILRFLEKQESNHSLLCLEIDY